MMGFVDKSLMMARRGDGGGDFEFFVLIVFGSLCLCLGSGCRETRELVYVMVYYYGVGRLK